MNPRPVIMSVFKEKEMDIIISSMLQDEVNLSHTRMEAFILRFQTTELEKLFEKSWSLMIAHSNKISYVVHCIAFDVGYEVLILSKVTNSFSASDGSYVFSYVCTTVAIFILTALCLTKYYKHRNIGYIAIAVRLTHPLLPRANLHIIRWCS